MCRDFIVCPVAIRRMRRSREDEEGVKEGEEEERPFMHIYTLTWTEEKLAGNEDGQDKGGRRKEKGGRRGGACACAAL